METMGKWFCDSFDGIINRAGDGWVEWVTYKDGTGAETRRDLRLVHHQPGCQFNQDAEHRKDQGIVEDMNLAFMLTADGLMSLLAMLQEPGSQAEVIEMIKRLHIPGYEQARRSFDQAIAQGGIQPNLPKGFYFQSDIQATLDFVAKQEAP